MTRWNTTVAALLMTLLLAGCAGAAGSDSAGDAPNGPAPSGKPWMQGTVTAKTSVEPVTTDCVSESDPDPNASVSSDDPPVCNPDPDTYGTLMVKGKTAGSPDPVPAAVHVPKNALLENQNGSTASWDDISKGTKVSVWITGEIAESYPPQVGATRVLLDETAQ